MNCPTCCSKTENIRIIRYEICRKHYFEYNQYNICVVIRIGTPKYKTKSKQYVIYTRSHYKVSLALLYTALSLTNSLGNGCSASPHSDILSYNGQRFHKHTMDLCASSCKAEK